MAIHKNIDFSSIKMHDSIIVIPKAKGETDYDNKERMGFKKHLK